MPVGSDRSRRATFIADTKLAEHRVENLFHVDYADHLPDCV